MPRRFNTVHLLAYPANSAPLAEIPKLGLFLLRLVAPLNYKNKANLFLRIVCLTACLPCIDPISARRFFEPSPRECEGLERVRWGAEVCALQPESGQYVYPDLGRPRQCQARLQTQGSQPTSKCELKPYSFAWQLQLNLRGHLPRPLRCRKPICSADNLGH